MSETRKRILFLTRLKPNVARDSWDEFVREILLPLVEGFPSVNSYDVYRIRGNVFQEEEGETDWHYVDVIEVNDVGAYEGDVASAMETDAGRMFEEGWLAMVEEWLPVYGSPIDEIWQKDSNS
ncbi:MAG: hypothetical protein WED83_03535 [Acidimicrobiia bacterium]